MGRRKLDAEDLARGYAELRASERRGRAKREVYGARQAKSFCVKMPAELAARLVGLAVSDGVSPQEVVRRLIQRALEERDAAPRGAT